MNTLAFVGDYPTEEELKRGPFTGTDARLFNSMLRAANIDRSQHLVTNIYSQPGERDEWTPKLAPDTARIQQEIERFNPCVIVPLGTAALWAFSGSANVGSVRGTLALANQIVPGLKILPTYHPSFVRKQFKYYSVVVGDLQKAAKEASNGPALNLPKRELIIAPTLADLTAIGPVLLRAPLLSVDIETAGGQITCIGFAPSTELAVVVPFVDKRNINRSYWASAGEEAAAWVWVRTILASPVPKLGQNFGGYDFYWLLDKYHIQPRNMYHDTRLIHHALFAELPKSLEFMQGYTSQGAWKHMGKNNVKRDD